MKQENKTEWIHVRVTKDLKDRVVRSSPSVTDFVIDAIHMKLAEFERYSSHLDQLAGGSR